MKTKASFLFGMLSVAGLAACSDTPTTVIPREPVAVSISVPVGAIQVGQTATFTATIDNDTIGPLSGVTWSTSVQAVATINATTGVVTGVAPGTTMITATSKFDPTKDASLTFTVLPGQVGPLILVIAPSTSTIVIGATIQFIAAGATGGVTYSSSNPAVATVDSESGNARGVAAGTAVVTATSKANPALTATAILTVNPSTVPISIPVLGSGSVTERFTAEVAAAGGFAYTTTWGNRGGVRGDAVKIWNVSGPTPVLIDSLKIVAVGTTSDVQISPDGSLLVVSTEGLGTGSIVIYSLTNPAKPTLVSRYQTLETERGVHTVKLGMVNGELHGFLQIDQGAVNGQFAAAALVIVDMSDPTNIQQLYVQAMGRPYIHDVFYRDGLLFTALWNDGMSIFDIGGGGRGGSPTNPVLISNIRTTTGAIHNIWWFQDPRDSSKRYVFLGEEGPSTGTPGPGATASGDIHVIDISTITAPREVAIYRLGANIGTHNFWVDEPSSVLYAAYYNGGVRAIDIRGDLHTCTQAQQSMAVFSVTGAPLCDLRLMNRELGSALTSGFYVWGVTGVGTRLYASDMAKGIVALDIAGLKR